MAPKQNKVLYRNFLSVLKEIKEGCIFLNDYNTVVFSNKPALKHFGIKEKSVKGKDFYELLEKYDLLALKDKIKIPVQTGRTINFLLKLEKPSINNEILRIKIKKSYNGLSIISEQTHDRKSLTLRDEIRRFKDVFEKENVGKSITSISGEIYVNNAFCRMLGYRKKELENKTWMDLTPPDEIENIQKKITLLTSGKRSSLTFRKNYCHKNGSPVWCEVNVKIRRDAEEKPLYFITTIKNISDQKKLSSILTDKEELFKTVFNSSPSGIIIFSLDNFRAVDVNRSFLRIIESKKEDIIGHSLEEFDFFVDPSDREVWQEALVKKGKTINVGLCIKCRFGRLKDLLVSFSTIELEKDKIAIAIVNDITSIKVIERKLKESEEKFYKTFHRNPTGMTITRMSDGMFIDVNDTFLKMFGYDRNEVIGHTSVELNMWSMEERERIVRMQTEKGGLINEELAAFSKYGNPVYILFSTVLFEIESEKYLLTSMIDISDRKKAEDSLRLSEEKFNKAFNNSPDAIVITRLSDGYIIDVNDSFLKMSGFNREEIIGRSSVLMNLWYDAEDRDKYVKKLSAEKSVRNFRTKFVKRSGEIRDFLINGEMFELRGEKCIIGILQDITEQLKMQQEIISLNADLEKKVAERTRQLESINLQLEAFTYSVSHDLKAPLRGIEGYSKLLSDTCHDRLDEEGKFFIKQIRNSTIRMNQLINDLLEYSRLERGSLRFEKVKIKELVSLLIENIKADNEASVCKIIINLPEVEIVSDQKVLTIVLRNLIQNAIKFTRNTEKPEIEINLTDGENNWLISVKDNGIGFDMKYHDRIFEIFQRLQRDEDFPGTGIGLAMVHKAMQRLNGKVWAESKPGSGSTFFIEIPKTAKL